MQIWDWLKVNILFVGLKIILWDILGWGPWRKTLREKFLYWAVLSGANLQGSEGDWIGLIRKLECDTITTEALGKPHEALRSKGNLAEICSNETSGLCTLASASNYIRLFREQDKASGQAAFFQGSCQGRMCLWAHSSHRSWRGQ